MEGNHFHRLLRISMSVQTREKYILKSKYHASSVYQLIIMKEQKHLLQVKLNEQIAKAKLDNRAAESDDLLPTSASQLHFYYQPCCSK